jgi:hypothetical protein
LVDPNGTAEAVITWLGVTLNEARFISKLKFSALGKGEGGSVLVATPGVTGGVLSMVFTGVGVLLVVLVATPG